MSFELPDVGLDPSWISALYMAAHRGIEFGSQIVFTYGPLGFLKRPGLWYGDLGALAFVYQGALHIALCISLVWALRRTLNAAIALILTSVVLIAAPAPFLDVPTTLTAVWCLAALSPKPPPFALSLVLFGGAALGAIETLVELRSGPVIWTMCAITLLAQERRRREVPMFIGCSALGFMLLWFAAGQGIGNLPDFVSNGVQIVSGYSEAMGVHTSSDLHGPAMLLLGLTLVSGAIFSSGSGRARLAAAAVIGLASFELFKEAVVRADPGHEPTFFATAVGVGAAMAFGRRRLLAVAAVAGLAAASIASQPAGLPLSFNPISHARDAADQIRTLLSPTRREQLKVFSAQGMINRYGLTPATLDLLKRRTVHIDPWEAGVAWAYGLKWDPLPVFQNYSAYTATLDRLNAAALRAPDGPQRILRETDISIDYRFAGWEAPAEQIAMLCNYVPLQTPTPPWLVLGKVPDRCGVPQLIDSIHTRYGDTVTLPPARADGVLYAKVQGAAVSGFERLGTFLYRAKFRHVVVNGTTRYHLIPGTAADGLVMDASPNVDYPTPFSLSPAARTIELTGPSGALRVDVYWMPVRPAPTPFAPTPQTGSPR